MATGTAWDDWERNAAKDDMAIEARDEPFWRGGEALLGGCAPSGDAWTACILSYYSPAIDMACTNDERKERCRVSQSRLFEKGDPPSEPRYMCRRRGALGLKSRSRPWNWSNPRAHPSAPGRDGRFALLEWSEPRQGGCVRRCRYTF